MGRSPAGQDSKKTPYGRSALWQFGVEQDQHLAGPASEIASSKQSQPREGRTRAGASFTATSDMTALR